MSNQAALGWFLIIVFTLVWVTFSLRQKSPEEREKNLTQLMFWACDVLIIFFAQSTFVNFYHREYWQLFSKQVDTVIISGTNQSQIHPPSVIFGAVFALFVWNMLGFSYTVYRFFNRGVKKLHEDDPKELEQLNPEG